MSYSAQDAIDMAKAMNHKIPVASIQAYACDQVNSIIWTAYPWNWTLASLTPIALSDGVQDYAHAQSDLYRIPYLRLVQTNLTPIEYRELDQKNHLGVEVTRKGGLGFIRSFSWESAISKIRLDVCPAVTGSTTLQLQGEYQKVPTAIKQSTLGTALVHPDHYFNTFLAGVRWMFYDLADDPRAGTSSKIGDGHVSYSGQLGVFMGMLGAMKQAEDYSDGEDLNFPSESYGQNTQGGWVGIFPS